MHSAKQTVNLWHEDADGLFANRLGYGPFRRKGP